VSHFSNDRVPVSLGLLLDTSGSMSAEKMAAARSAIDRLIYELLDKDDELFLVEFATNARLTQGWTTDRRLISRGVREVSAAGGRDLRRCRDGTPTAQAGTHVEAAAHSDGNEPTATSVGA
jgi:Mg-chelatase subunit ChlD